MRQIVLDTETTGLNPALGHKVVEIGALELFNCVATGRTFHSYINPQRDMPPEAEAVHGLTTAFLRDKPVFSAVAKELLGFIAGDVLVIHNASFDIGFLNAEFGCLGMPMISAEKVVDTLHLARQRHPAGPNSLDALCKRYGIDNSKRTKHGALLDAELLAEVYLELIGGRQQALSLISASPQRLPATMMIERVGPRPMALESRLTEDERAAHAQFVETLGTQALWKSTR